MYTFREIIATTAFQANDTNILYWFPYNKAI